MSAERLNRVALSDRHVLDQRLIPVVRRPSQKANNSLGRQDDRRYDRLHWSVSTRAIAKSISLSVELIAMLLALTRSRCGLQEGSIIIVVAAMRSILSNGSETRTD
jgi:hypothetical protein